MKLDTVYKEFRKTNNTYCTDLETLFKNMEIAFNNEIVQEKLDLLKKIAVEHNLNYDELHVKHMNVPLKKTKRFGIKSVNVKNKDAGIKTDTVQIKDEKTGDATVTDPVVVATDENSAYKTTDAERTEKPPVVKKARRAPAKKHVAVVKDEKTDDVVKDEKTTVEITDTKPKKKEKTAKVAKVRAVREKPITFVPDDVPTTAVLDKQSINGVEYYIDRKNGVIFDKNNQIVGQLKDNIPEIFPLEVIV
ncbi:MAG: hypothetical protein Faunusvirus40_3 [Faunusvirus sp.]|jgi:hypothetical protein|uniref:Uncharacterized protein n=1 Tax=Faunusvirus sp. TaxID=2487766 RepID=A0A3G5A1G8_9VIRU|nr:MAG: hypothetical protein Faunusvirus40_3 [Faunusvirus sp.]